ncbi:hypothetical protein VFPPC_14903 [Pochonia chlamydosporia 170]|uniref:NACHT-NTPase and P-loop NTPases N-terminal domain-containing protein n=1 Tax=Pochonia chlamydosporia 170 TaxID=1380566 RepID=A0A179EYZ3_METCM|nr:hypothetical protein VFPPC_14903 [Pochonia chlamydosporia 170]OAQ58119.1 hypothetical protein VFPPC_14903 [Pochonia chlamydosporia 170]
MPSTINPQISDIINTLEAAANQYEIVKDDASLPKAFHGSGQGLHLVNEALQTAQRQIGRRDLAGNSMQECASKAKLVKSIFERVAQPLAEISRFELYKAAVKEVGEGRMVEDLVKGIMNNVCVLAENEAIKEAMEDHVAGIRDAIETLSQMDPSVPKEGSGDSYNHWGSGDMLNAPGGKVLKNIFSGEIKSLSM